MPLSISRSVIEFLQARPNEKFTARDIAIWIFNTYPEQCREKQSKSKASVIPLNSDDALLQQLVAEISSQRPLLQKKNSNIKTTDGRPRQYYYSVLTDEAELVTPVISASNNQTNTDYSEADLYPVLSEFLWRDLGIYSKRIDEKRSKNGHGSGGNKWLFPDVVGLEDLSHGWHSEIKHIVQQMSDQKTKLWSFEVKKSINRSNIREVYFQAVSNSSWANFGYLVAAEIQGAEKELRILSGLHGIGFIKLDVLSPADSEIIIPAKEKLEIDWNATNRLADENSDFLEYIKLVRQFYQTGEHRVKEWDLPTDRDIFI